MIHSACEYEPSNVWWWWCWWWRGGYGNKQKKHVANCFSLVTTNGSAFSPSLLFHPTKRHESHCQRRPVCVWPDLFPVRGLHSGDFIECSVILLTTQKPAGEGVCVLVKRQREERRTQTVWHQATPSDLQRENEGQERTWVHLSFLMSGRQMNSVRTMCDLTRPERRLNGTQTGSLK